MNVVYVTYYRCCGFLFTNKTKQTAMIRDITGIR